MDPIDRADAYLTIPPSYARYLGGIRWSAQRDAIERPSNNSTLAVYDGLAAILEGVFSQPSYPPFAYVLFLLHAMNAGGAAPFDKLHRAFKKTRKVAARGRNAGLLISELCRGLPASEDVLVWCDVSLALRCLRLYGEHNPPELTKEPALSPPELQSFFDESLNRLHEEALVHWFTYGTAPGSGGEELARQTETLATRLARMLELVDKSERLAGAAALIPMLNAALCLPPRQRCLDSLPQGGYCDVAARGDLAQLLPHQFALDPDEFVRRFAGNELLYFKREEPHQQLTSEIAVVVDLGVRAWGVVRLALAAATFAILQRAAKKVLPAKLFLTSTTKAIDLLQADNETLLELLESSDFSTSPGERLSQALAHDGGQKNPRDVILLTHPRNLTTQPVIEAAQSRRPSDRLFTATVNESGEAMLCNWTSNGPIALKQFRLDLSAQHSRAVKDTAQQRQPSANTGWTGDIEPIPFPFCPGMVGEPQNLAFDAEGEWLVISTRDGVLMGLALDGKPPEILPRAYSGGVVLQRIITILSVSDGVVVVGVMKEDTRRLPHASSGKAVTEPQGLEEKLVAAHYLRSTRAVTLHHLGPMLQSLSAAAHPDLNCIVIRGDLYPDTRRHFAIDLATHERFPESTGAMGVGRQRALQARRRNNYDAMEPIELSVDNRSEAGHVVARNNSLNVHWGTQNWELREPMIEGRPLLENVTLHRAQFAGDVLVLALTKQSERLLVLFQRPTGRLLGELRHWYRHTFTLSRTGRMLARKNAAHSVVVSNTATPSKTIASASRGRLHTALEVRLSVNPFHLTIAIGTFAHQFGVLEGRLRYSLAFGWDKSPIPKGPVTKLADVGYDTSRFPPSEITGTLLWKAAVDRLGQVLLFNGEGLIATFLVRRERAAIWMPGGIFWGDPELIGGPSTPEADVKFGQAIQAFSVPFSNRGE